MNYRVLTFAKRKYCWGGEVDEATNDSAYTAIAERHGLKYAGSQVANKGKQRFIIILG
jgi:hypothetical protein